MTAYTAPELRPLSIGQILDRAIRLYRNNFLTFVGITALIQIPAALLGIASVLLSNRLVNIDPTTFEPGSTNPFGISTTVLLSILGGSLVLGIVVFVLTQIATAAITRAVADNYLGKKVTIGEAYRSVGRSWVSLLGALLYVLGIFIVLFIPLLIPCANILWAIPAVGAIAFLSGVVIPLIAPVVILEKRSARMSLHRAWDLARRRFWWLVGFMLLLTLFSSLITLGPSFLMMWILQSTVGLTSSTSSVIQQVVNSLLRAIYLPLQLTCITLVYFDLRIRTEGLDLALLADADEAAPQDADAVLQKAPAPKLPFMPTLTEIGYFCAISLGFFAIVAMITVLFAGIMTAVLGTSFGL